MLSSLKSKIKNVIARLPIIGPGVRFGKNMARVPALANETHNRVVALNDQLLALPATWSPVSEQVWEAQAVASQLMASDLRAAIDRLRKDQAAILDSIDRRLEALEQRLDASTQKPSIHAA